MKIEVFAEDNTAAEKIAEFYCDEAYNRCVPLLEQWASDNGYLYITESVKENES
jgi:hypothetical protein